MTLGKRIAANRRRLGLTQDQLAEQLGITAQAVSKWENDQSCPDITMLPKLAEIFGVSTDELLGHQTEQTVHQAEVVTDDEEEKDNNGHFIFQWDDGKRHGLGFAICALLVGILTLISRAMQWDVSFWNILWPSALLVWGIGGLFPRFSVFSLGMTLFGGYFLASNLNLLPFSLSSDYIFPICVVLFGLGLLVDALRKPKKKRGFHFVNSNGENATSVDCGNDEDSFHCNLNFGEATHLVTSSKLQSGSATVNFGHLTVDLSSVECVAINCQITAECAFGEIHLMVPAQYHIKCVKETAFGNVTFEGEPSTNVGGVILLDANANFGQILVSYI